MVDFDIIEPVDKPTGGVNGLVIVEKPNGKLWICLDPRPLNQAIKREHLHLRTAELLFSQISRAKDFSKLDASSGYWQIEVDREYSNLLKTAVWRYWKVKHFDYVSSHSKTFDPNLPTR